jgi:hypothetical protein
VSWPPSHTARVLCGSIGLWFSSGVLYACSTRTAASASPRSTSPRFEVRSPPNGCTFSGGFFGAVAMSSTGVSAAYRTFTSSAAARACSNVSATTTPMGWPL